MKSFKQRIISRLSECDPHDCLELYSDGSGGIYGDGVLKYEWKDWDGFESFLNKDKLEYE